MSHWERATTPPRRRKKPEPSGDSAEGLLQEAIRDATVLQNPMTVGRPLTLKRAYGFIR